MRSSSSAEPRRAAGSHPSFAHLSHRPWPLPESGWLWSQVWEDLLFLHWPVPAIALRPLIPPALAIEEREGSAWLGIVPFRLRIRLRGLPALPRIGIFPEINVRTYVTAEGRPGVWFFSLDASSRLAVAAARRLFHLPYRRSRFDLEPPRDPEGWIGFRSERVEAPSPAVFAGKYRPRGPARPAEPGSLDHFLTERYRLYAADPAGAIRSADVHHAPWPLAPAEVEIAECTIAEPLGIPLVAAPRALFTRRLEVATWPLAAVARP